MFESSPPAHRRPAQRVRRGLLIGAAASALAAAAPAVSSAASSGSSGSAWSFATQPNLQPPQLSVTSNKHKLGSGDIFTAPYKDAAVASPEVGQPGALIMDQGGNPIWFQPAPRGQVDENLETQSYGGKPVLTFWQGKLATGAPSDKSGLPAGAPESGAKFLVLNQSYKTVKTITGQNGWTADFHELLITPQGDAIFLVAKKVKANLTAEGGPANGSYEDSGIQAVDLATGKALYTWDIGQHVPLSQSMVSAPTDATDVWDAYHLNSIFAEPDGSLVISARNTWSVYDITPTGAGTVNWTLDAKPSATDSSFAIGGSAAFSWQHDAQILPNGNLTLFDDHCCSDAPLKGTRPTARGEVLKLDPAAKTATLVKSYQHRSPLVDPSQGNMQTLSSGNVFIDFGQIPEFAGFTAAGSLIYDAYLPAADSTYRGYVQPWTGTPTTKPSLKIVTKGSNATIDVSWNGATKVASYAIYAGTSPSNLKLLGKVKRAGFETAVTVQNLNGDDVKVTALDASGKALGTTATDRAS